VNANTPFELSSRTVSPAVNSSSSDEPAPPPTDASSNDGGKNRVKAIFIQVKQFMTNANFVSLVTVNFFQMYHLFYLISFANIIGNRLIGDNAMPPEVKSLFYGSLFVVPKVNFMN
jgi:hypothetical protein